MTRTATAPARHPAAHLLLRVLLACAFAFAILLAGASGALAGDDDDADNNLPLDDLLNNEDIMPGEDVGPHPIGRYLLTSNDDRGLLSNLDNVVPTLYASFADTAWSINRWVVRIGLAVFEWVYSLDLVTLLTDPAIALADSMDENFIGRLGLGDFALFLAVSWSGYHLFRRRTALGLGQLAVSLVVFAFGALLIANPAWVMESFVRYALDLSTEVIMVSTADEDGDPNTEDWCPDLEDGDEDTVGRAVRPLTRELHCALIGQPYDVIAWGALLDGRCAELRGQILDDQDLHPASEEARNIMRGGAAGTVGNLIPDQVPDVVGDAAENVLPGGECAAHADFNEEWTTDRLGMAWISLAVSLMVIMLLGIVALTVLAAQLIVGAHLVLLPFAVMLGTVPGTGRQLLLKWASNVMQAAGVMVALSFLLAIFLKVTTLLLGLGVEDASLITRYLLLLVAVFMIFRARKRLVTQVQYMSIRAAERLQTRDAQGRVIGMASRSSGTFGLETTHALRRGARPLAASREEHNRVVRAEVERMIE